MELVATLIVEEASLDVVIASGLGLKLALAPLGNPFTLKVTFPVNPPEGVIVIV